MSPVHGRAALSSFGESCQVRRHGRGFGRNSVLTTSCQGSGTGVGCQQALLLSDPICYWVMHTHRVPCTALSNAACNSGVNTSFVATWPWIQTWLRQASTYLRLEDTSDFKVWVFLPLGGGTPLFISSLISHCLEPYKYSRLYLLFLFNYFCQGLNFLWHNPSARKSHRLLGLSHNEYQGKNKGN